MNKISLTAFTINLISVSLLSAFDGFGFERFGFRVGIDGESTANIESYEVYGVAEAPWQWDFRNDRKLLFEFELSGGVLDAEDETAGFFKIAPQLRLQSTDHPISIVVSSGPAILSEDEFDDLDLGGNFQFVSTLGLDWQLNEDWAIGYRFQHTSNAGIYDKNHGLNMHTIGTDYRF